MGETGEKTDRPKRKPGRPRKSRHREDYIQHGAPPEDLLTLNEWLHSMIAQTAAQARDERGVREVREEIRAAALAISRLLPAALTADAQGLLDSAQIDISGDPPPDTLLRVVWLVRVLAADLWMTITTLGELDARDAARRREVSQELRAAAGAAARALPADAYVEARRILASENRLIQAPGRAPELRPWEDDEGRPPSLSVVEVE